MSNVWTRFLFVVSLASDCLSDEIADWSHIFFRQHKHAGKGEGGGNGAKALTGVK